MASQGVAANSRLAQMQMRFQQKQLQERELRRMEMTEEQPTTTGDSNATVTSSKAIGNGKVRQMFDERRRGAGIDRSNPLKPISPSTATRNSGSRTSPTRKQLTPATTQRRHINTGRSAVEHSVLNGNLPKEFSSISLSDTRSMPGDRNNNTSSKESAYARTKSSNSIKLNPLVTKKSPSTVTKTRPPIPGRQNGVAADTGTTRTRASPVPKTVKKTSAATVRSTQQPRKQTAKMAATGIKSRSSADTPPAGMVTCKYCNRHFNQERIAKHETVCEKMVHTKRKVFDAAKHRVMGTDAESFLKKQQGRTGSMSRQIYSSSTNSVVLGPSKKNNWRKKHEEFITAIRAAKQVQAHLARGGKLSDLPPPPPSENPDYIQCPHCSRRFNEAAAERHIPKCATMLHNKPKAGTTSTRKR